MVSQATAHQKDLLVKQGCLDRPAGGAGKSRKLHTWANKNCKRHWVSVKVGEDLLRFFHEWNVHWTKLLKHDGLLFHSLVGAALHGKYRYTANPLHGGLLAFDAKRFKSE